MSTFSFAFITPSYAPDFQRCKLLCWSIRKFIDFPVRHFIIVERTDFDLFRELENANTTILIKEDVLPFWIKRIPFFGKKNIWLNLKGYQSGNWIIRGWLIQQLIKLAAAQYVNQEVMIFVDSDVAFIDFFDLCTLTHRDMVRLFRVPHATKNEGGLSQKWKQTAKTLLGLPAEKEYPDNYISQIITWRRSNLLKLYEYIEGNFNKDWLTILSGFGDLSEYILYGMFIDYVMQEGASGHYDDHLQKICWCYWDEKPMSDDELRSFFKEAKTSGFRAVMISAKSSTDLSIAQFQNYLDSTDLTLEKLVA